MREATGSLMIHTATTTRLNNLTAVCSVARECASRRALDGDDALARVGGSMHRARVARVIRRHGSRASNLQSKRLGDGEHFVEGEFDAHLVRVLLPVIQKRTEIHPDAAGSETVGDAL